MRITSRGQVTIPREIREKLGLLVKMEIEFYIEAQELRLKKKSPKRGEELIQKLTSKKFIKMSTDEIMALTREE